MNQVNSIVVSGNLSANVSPIHTIIDLAGFGKRFAEIAQESLGESALRLTTAAGDVAASTVDDIGGDDDFAEELADVLICVAAIAACRDISGERLIEALNYRTTAQVGAVAHKALNEMMTARGLIRV